MNEQAIDFLRFLGPSEACFGTGIFVITGLQIPQSHGATLITITYSASYYLAISAKAFRNSVIHFLI